MQMTHNSLAEKAGCAKDGDYRCDHSVPDIVKLLLGTREDRDRSSGSDVRPVLRAIEARAPGLPRRDPHGTPAFMVGSGNEWGSWDRRSLQRNQPLPYTGAVKRRARDSAIQTDV